MSDIKKFYGTDVINRVVVSPVEGLDQSETVGLTGTEEAVLIVPRSSGGNTAYLGALTFAHSGTGVRVGPNAFTVDTGLWKVIGLDMQWREARTLVEDAEDGSKLWVFVFGLGVILGGLPVYALIALLRSFVNASRRTLLPLWVRVTMRSFAGAGRVFVAPMVLQATVASLILLMLFPFLRSELSEVSQILFWTSVLVCLVASCVDAAEAFDWTTEVDNLSSLFADQESGHRSPDHLRASLADRAILKTVEHWENALEGRGVLPALGIEAPHVPWSIDALVVSDPNPLRLWSMAYLEVLRDGTKQWLRSIRGTTMESPAQHPSVVRTGPRPGAHHDESVRSNAAAEAAVQYARYLHVQRLKQDGYLIMQPARIVLSDLGRSTLALPALALVEDIPFAVCRQLAVIEDLVLQGQGQAAIQNCGRFLEAYLKDILVSFTPVTYPSPEWCYEAFTRGWVGILGDKSDSHTDRDAFFRKVRDALRSAILGEAVPTGWTDADWNQIRSLLDAEHVSSENDAHALRTLALGIRKHNQASGALHAYLLSLGGPEMKKLLGTAETKRWLEISIPFSKRVLGTHCAVVSGAYEEWRGGFKKQVERASLYHLLKRSTALLDNLVPESGEARDAAQDAALNASALANQWVAADKSSRPITVARNQVAHDQGDANAHIDRPEIVSLALHTLWLTRIFVTSVEKVRQRQMKVQSVPLDAP